MDLPRFFLPPDQIRAPEVLLKEEDANHVARVLRMREGDAIFVLDGLGTLYHVRLSSVDKRETRGEIVSQEAATGELPVPVTLVQGMPKGEKFDWILQKATELGVARIVPVITERSVVRLSADRSQDKVRRWQAIAKEAAEQCERAKVPVVEAPVELGAWLKAPVPDGVARLACLERQGGVPLARALEGEPAQGYEIVVGPEGGFSPAEVERLVASGARNVSLGGRILRSETASLAALAVMASILER